MWFLIGTEDKILFTRHLGVMLEAGLTITEALDTLAAQTRNGSLKKVIFQILADLQNGQTLGKALAKHPRVFDVFYQSVVAVGEEAGKLEINLSHLAAEMQKNNEFVKKLQGALMYPAIILLAAFVVGGGISIFVLPKLTEVFNSMDVTLPASTRALIVFANIMRSFGILIMSGIVMLMFGLAALVQTATVKPIWQRFVLSLPFIGGLVSYSDLSSIFRNLSVMTESGLPITKALRVAAASTNNMIYRAYLEKMLRAVNEGKSIGDELAHKRYGFMPLIVSKMVAVGEKTGTLEKSFGYLGEYFATEVDVLTKNLPTIIEPLMLIVVALIVAFLAMAVISPMYQLTSSMGGR